MKCEGKYHPHQKKLFYLSSQCEATFLSYPDTNLHFLLLAAAGLAFSLLASPIFYGNSVCAELFSNFSWQNIIQ